MDRVKVGAFVNELVVLDDGDANHEKDERQEVEGRMDSLTDPLLLGSVCGLQ